MTVSKTDWQNYLAEHKDVFIAQLQDFLRIPSISSLPEHRADVERAGEWVVKRLEQAGLENIQLMPTAGHPAVYADWLHAEGKPTVLIYGHFDVQPVDPVHLWEADPFEPIIKDDKIIARGSTDDKGNMLVPILALEAFLKTKGSLPFNVKLIFEGQEEIGSPDMPDFIAANKELLACDFAVSADGGQWGEDQPSLLVGLRGICALEITLSGANSDLHSGSYGGAVQNPIHALVKVLDSMRADDGRILVEGFYDNVRELSEEDRRHIAETDFDEATIKESLGIDAFWGEAGYTPLERIWARPTLEINGIYGGFQGDGVKTVLPNEAHAKMTCRLVADQDPRRITQLIEQHVHKHLPEGVKASIEIEGSSGQPYLMPADHPGNEAAKRAHANVYEKTPLYIRNGGSIPICGMFLEHLGVYTVNFAFAMRDEKAHAPNEFFRLSNFIKGQQAYGFLFEELGQL